MPALQPPIATARLVLRPFTPTDLDDLYDYMSRPDVVRYLYGGVKDRAETEQVLRQWLIPTDLRQDGDRLVLAVDLAERQKVIGEVSLKCASQAHRQAEIGWVFNPDFSGHGYATEAAAALMSLGFQTYAFHRIFARCDSRNTASHKLMERLGMRREAHFRQNELFKGDWGDELWYAVLRSEWPAPIA